MNKNHLNILTRNLDPEQLDALGLYFKDKSDLFFAHAKNLRDKHREQFLSAKRMKEFEREKEHLCQFIHGCLLDENSLNFALKKVSKISGKNEKTLMHWYRSYLHEENNRARAARKITVIRLAQAGFTNKEIAEKTGASLATVSRDIRKVLNPEI